MSNQLYIGLILHFVGDYIFQNNAIASNKRKYNFVCIFHALVYSLPFLFVSNGIYWWIIFVSHFFIDRFALAGYWIRLINWDWKNSEPWLKEPAYISIWVFIITDNTFHIIINSICIHLSMKP